VAEDPPATVPLDAEERVRRLLAEVEAALRGAALAALADWSRLEVLAPALVPALAAIERPGMGAWNGLLGALRAARAAALRDAPPERRAAIEAAPHLSGALAGWEEALPPPEALSAKALGALARHALPGRPRARDGFAAAIALRNRAVHDAPTDPAFWSEALRSLEGLAPTLLEAAARGALPEPPPAWAAPWVVPGEPAGPGAAGGPALTYRGLERSGAALHAPPGGATAASPERGRQVLLALARLSGRADLAERDVRTLLSRLAPEETRGVLLGDFLVGPPVGEGGFATVHAARQVTTGRKVAVKLLRDGLPEESRERFRREAEFLSRFSSPHIVAVLAAGEEPWSLPRGASASGEPWLEALVKGAPVKTFIALEWVEGETLEAVFARAVREGRSPSVATCMRWLADLAGALGAVHAAGLVHRDVKPANIMVAHDGRALVMDFGIARTQDESRTLLTATGAAVGTPAYMAPEQLRAAPGEPDAGPSVDVYALCACFYELLSLWRLFDHDRASGDVVRVKKIGGERPRPLPRAVPPEVRALVQGGVEPEARDRPASMAALEEDARRILQDRPPLYRRPSLARRAVLAWRRSPAAYALTTAVVLLAILGVAVYLRDVGAERTEAERARGEERAARLLAESREAETRRALAGALIERASRARADAEWLRAEVLYAGALLVEDARATREALLEARARSPALRWRSAGPPLAATAVSWSPDGRLLATTVSGRERSGNDRTAVFDAETGRALALLPGHPIGSGRPAFSSDGRLLFTTGADRRVLVHDRETWTTRAVATLPSAPQAAGFVGGSSRIACILPEPKVVLLDAATGEVVIDGPLTEGDGTPALLASGAVVRALADGGAVLGDPSAPASIRTFPPAPKAGAGAGGEARPETIPEAAATPDGRVVAAAAADGSVAVYDGTSGELLLALPAGVEAIDAIALSSDGRRLAVLELNGALRVLSVEGGGLLATPHAVGAMDGVLAFSPDGRRIAGATILGLVVFEIPGVPDRPLAPRLALPEDSSDFDQFAAAAERRAVIAGPFGWRAIDVESGDEVSRARTEGGAPASIVVDRGGREVRIVDIEPRLTTYDLESGRSLRSARCEGRWVNEMSGAPDGRSLALTGPDGKVRIVDAVTGVVRERIAAHGDGPARAVALGAGDALASAGEDGRVFVRTGPEGATRTLEVQASALAWSPDGRLLAAVESDGLVRIRDVSRADGATRLLGSAGPFARSIAWSDDGARIATGAGQGRASVFDVGGERLAVRLEVEGTGPCSVAFAEGGRALLTGRSGVVERRDLESPRPARLAAPLIPGARGLRLASSRDGMRLAVTLEERRDVLLVSLAAGAPRVVASTPLPVRSLTRPSFSPDGRSVAVVGGGELHILDASTGAILSRMDLEPHIKTIGTMRDTSARCVWVSPGRIACTNDTRIALIDIAAGTATATRGVVQSSQNPLVAASGDGRHVLWSDGIGTDFELLDGETLEPTGRVTPSGRSHGGALVEGGTPSLLALLDSNVVERITLEGNRVMGTIAGLEVAPDDFATAPRGDRVAFTLPGRGVRLFRIEEGGMEALCTLEGHDDGTTGVAFAGEAGGLLATTGNDGRIVVWDLAEVERVLAAPAPALYAESVARTGLALKDGEVVRALAERMGRLGGRASD